MNLTIGRKLTFNEIEEAVTAEFSPLPVKVDPYDDDYETHVRFRITLRNREPYSYKLSEGMSKCCTAQQLNDILQRIREDIENMGFSLNQWQPIKV